MFKYRKVEVPYTKSDDSEVRVSNAKPARSYLRYIYGLVEEKKQDPIILRGTGFVIPKCLGVADLVRRRIKGLYQIVEFGSLEMKDTYEPMEEGLDKVVLSRKVPFVTVKLSFKPLEKTHPGYSDPLPESEVQAYTPFEGGAPRGDRSERPPRGEFRGRFRRGRRGGRFRDRPYDDADYYPEEGERRQPYYESGRPRRRRGGPSIEPPQDRLYEEEEYYEPRRRRGGNWGPRRRPRARRE